MLVTPNDQFPGKRPEVGHMPPNQPSRIPKDVHLTPLIAIGGRHSQISRTSAPCVVRDLSRHLEDAPSPREFSRTLSPGEQSSWTIQTM